jgi:poly-beta-1,6-N-acetyl-D-glucosamine synthase
MHAAIAPLAVWIFWLAILEVAYSYAFYPLLLRLLSKRFGRSPASDDAFTPNVAIVMPVYNEEKVIGEKLASIFAIDYPAEKLSVWIGSDRSTDRTEEIVRSFGDRRVHLWTAAERSGKALILNRLVPQVDADVLVFTDADIMLDAKSIRALSRHFADPQVGGVGGVTLQQSDAPGRSEESAYRNFETAQKKMESLLHSTISAFGSFYAIRKNLFVNYHPHTYSNDDVMMPMNIIRQGYRMFFEESAVSYENASKNMGTEFRRRVRIGAGNFQAFFWLLDFLDPRKGWPWFCYVSHKVSRWFSPMFLCIAAVSCGIAALAGSESIYRLLFASGTLLVVSGLLHKIIPLPLTRQLYYFLAMNAAIIFGFFRFLSGIRSATWSRTERI